MKKNKHLSDDITSTQVRPSLPEQFRLKIQTQRKKLGISLIQLGEMVHVSDSQLNHIESGLRMPTPSLLTRILASLGFGEREFLEGLELTSETWTARKIHSLLNDKEKMQKFLTEARQQSGLSREKLAADIGASPEYILKMEQGAVMPSPRFLHLYMAAMCLSPLSILGPIISMSIMASLAIKHKKNAAAANQIHFAKKFVATVFERDGFHTNPDVSNKSGDTIEVELGGGWKLSVSAKLRFQKEEEPDNGKEKHASCPKAGKGN